MAKDLEMGYLLDFYGEVLTEKQCEMLRQYYNDDLSLSEIGENFGITRQGNDLDPIRDEAVDILRMQYKRGNNGYVKTKYVTLTIEAENLPAARARPSICTMP